MVESSQRFFPGRCDVLGASASSPMRSSYGSLLAPMVVDEAGRLVPTVDGSITFVVEGEGRLIGVDNGNLVSHETYKASRREAFHGVCFALVRAGARAGQIRVTATSPSLKSAEVAITTET